MAVLLFQVGIFLIIIASASFGKKGRNLVIILLSVFTLALVFKFWLILVQFVTILIGYIASNSILENKKIKKDKTVIKHQDTIRQIPDKEDQLEYDKLYRKYSDNKKILKAAPRKPFEPINPTKDKPSIGGFLFFGVLLFLIILLLSYTIPFVLLANWIKETFLISSVEYNLLCGATSLFIQLIFFIKSYMRYKPKQKKYKIAMKDFYEKLEAHKVEVMEFEKKHRSLNEIEKENIKLTNKMALLEQRGVTIRLY